MMQQECLTNYTIYRLVSGSLIVPFHSYLWVTIRGKENVPRQGPLILVCNHCSFLDPMLMGYAVPRFITFFARDTLFKQPLKWILQRLATYPISRDAGDLRAIKTVQKLLEDGQGVLLFPEGTRSPNGEIQPFKPGVGLLTLRSQAPIVPVYIAGTFAAWPRNRKVPKPGRITIYFGPPIDPSEYEEVPRNRSGFEQVAKDLEQRVKNLEKEATL
jgi:1-acyl-sn-glycerol-3-phosphate acyltransferase